MADKIARAMAYLDRLPVAVSGAHGHNATMRAACECFRFGLSEGEAWECLQWFNTYRCQPKWSEHDLRHKLTDARKMVNAAGQDAKHIGGQQRGYGRPTRTFVAPPLPVRRVRVAAPPEPSWFSDVADEEARWLAAVAELGYASVPEFDALYDARAAERRAMLEVELPV